MISFYQVLSRTNDVNGNPYRLICCYDSEGTIVKLVECRSSSPDYLHSEEIRSAKQIISLFLNPSEYNTVKKQYPDILEHSN